MEPIAKDADVLKGEQVAFAGRLASMTRMEAEELVRVHGGCVAAQVNRQTSLLVIGREGLPLRKDGRISRKLAKAQVLQRRGQSISILSEEEFLARLGLESRQDEIRRLYSTTELTQLLGIDGARLRAWVTAGFIRPVESRHGVAFFDFRQVAGAKTLCDLVKAGVAAKRIRRSLAHLQKWAGSDEPITQLAILEKDGDLLVRVGGALADSTGQLLLDFGNDTEDSPLNFAPREPSADEWFALGLEHEEAGRLEEAEAAYRKALLTGSPEAVFCYNLANVLYAMDRKQEAMERFYQSVELDGQDAEAWNNLGTTLVDLDRSDEAKAAYEKAVALGHADAHYNLADLLEDLGERQQARGHWQAYLRLDQDSQWARYARRRLERRAR